MKPSFIRKIFSLFCTFLITLLLSSCISTSQNSSGSGASKFAGPVLKVGISSNMPPLVYRQNGQLQGLEIDLATQLGQYLQREIKFVELKWDKQIHSLEERRIDIIMSGMSITPKRSYRVSFAQPYMRSGQMLLVRMNQAQLYSSGIFSLMGNRPAIGTIENTTGDYFITKTINRANITRFSTSQKAVSALIKEDIDVFVHDAPVICYFAAQNEKQRITPIPQISNEEQLAWAVNKMDQNLLNQVNSFLTTARGNGSLEQTVRRWIPLMFKR